MNYKWNILNQASNLQEVLSNILKWKNIPKDKVREFIDFKMQPHDPFLLTNMDKAIKRIKKAIELNEKIIILGDYDCDGVSATALMYIGLRSKFTNVIWKVPDRFKDGYGINKRLIDLAKEEDCKLIITVDNGIAAKEQIEYAESLDIDVIVTDHHQMINGLPTEITVNPQIDDNYPFKSICGCMVAFKLILGLIPEMSQSDPELYEELLSIAIIGTIADVMDLMDENRYYIKKGLKYLSNPRNLGLRVLFEKLKLINKNLTTSDIGFSVGPCLNAAGRLDSADLAVNLLLTDDIVEANRLADLIIKLNEKRKDLQKQAIDNLTVSENDKFIIVNLDGIGHGLLGIIAGKIAEKYQKPCFVLGGNEVKKMLSGSGRSIYGYDINSCVQVNKDIVSGGGHAAACGVSLKFEDLDEFKKRCNNHFSNWLENTSSEDLIPSIDITNEIPLSLINERLINNLDKLKPYGNKNEEPFFVCKNLKVDKAKVVGRNLNTIQFIFSNGWNSVKAVGFSDVKEKYEELMQPKEVDVVFTLDLNEWPTGTFTPQLIIKDIKKTEV